MALVVSAASVHRPATTNDVPQRDLRAVVAQKVALTAIAGLKIAQMVNVVDQTPAHHAVPVLVVQVEDQKADLPAVVVQKVVVQKVVVQKVVVQRVVVQRVVVQRVVVQRVVVQRVVVQRVVVQRVVVQRVVVQRVVVQRVVVERVVVERVVAKVIVGLKVAPMANVVDRALAHHAVPVLVAQGEDQNVVKVVIAKRVGVVHQCRVAMTM
ncbi:hypothetical protein NA78x_001647 [Anatilimnocola sp. NA78]|uniref:hypothetical protein n=1 Tax=Anatilimnocola sp. NA78 TaxID=3415683 RepID=UPI003CE54F01